MTRIILNRYGMDDFQRDGKWVATYMEDGYYCHTKSSTLWHNLKSRCGKQGPYKSCNILFESYQRFTSWCVEQRGYGNKDPTGRSWCLDKDILLPMNKNYSEDTCCFVPIQVNALFTYVSLVGGKCLPGVMKRRNQFVAELKIEGKSTAVGRFYDEFEAHRCWQVNKINQLVGYKLEHEYLGAKILEGFDRHIEVIKEDYANYRISFLSDTAQALKHAASDKPDI